MQSRFHFLFLLLLCLQRDKKKSGRVKQREYVYTRRHIRRGLYLVYDIRKCGHFCMRKIPWRLPFYLLRGKRLHFFSFICAHGFFLEADDSLASGFIYFPCMLAQTPCNTCTQSARQKILEKMRSIFFFFFVSHTERSAFLDPPEP